MIREGDSLMRTIAIIILTAFIAIAICAPQSDAAPQPEKGIQFYVAKAGLAAANVIGKDRQVFGLNPGARLGGTGGIGVGYALNKKFMIQPELMLTQKGFKITGDENTLYSQYMFVDVPVLFKLRAQNLSDIKPSLYLGPVFSYKVQSDTWAENADPNLATNETDTLLATSHHAEDTSRDFDLGIALGVDLHSFTSNVIVDFRYTMGMLKMDNVSSQDVRHSNFTVTLGYAF